MSLDKLLEKAHRAAAARRRRGTTDGAEGRDPGPVTDTNTVPPEEIGRAEEAHASSPRDLQLRAYLAFLYYAGKRYEEAIPHFRDLLEQGFRPATQHFHLGNCYLRLGRTQEAVEHWRSCLEASPPPEIAAKTRARLEWHRLTAAGDGEEPEEPEET